MALRFDFTHIKDEAKQEDLGWMDDRTAAPLSQHIVFLTINVGIGRITESNADEFYARASIIERIYGNTMRIGGESVHITPQDVQRHIGLVTNVANETRAAWLKRNFNTKGRDIPHDYKRVYNQYINQQEEAA